MSTSWNSKDIDDLLVVGGEFLRAACVRPEVMLLLLRFGYSEAEHQRGWALYLRILGHRKDQAARSAPRGTEAIEAHLQLEQFEEASFRRATAALIRLYPEQYDYLFGDGLAPNAVAGACEYVRIFLERYVALRDGTDPRRSSLREIDRAAACSLEGHNVVNRHLEVELRRMLRVVGENDARSDEANDFTSGLINRGEHLEGGTGRIKRREHLEAGEGDAEIQAGSRGERPKHRGAEQVDETASRPSESALQAAAEFEEWFLRWQKVTLRMQHRARAIELGFRSDAAGAAEPGNARLIVHA